jgi:hypothetical protein
MKTVITSALMLLLVGCGNGKTSTSGPADISGSWKIILTENQALTVSLTQSGPITVDPNPTEIAISLGQSNGILTGSGIVYSGNTGCETSSWSWYNTGPYPNGWNFGNDSFEFDSGLVSDNTVSINLVEALSVQNGQPTQSGTLKLIGTVQNDVITGTFTDTCVPSLNSSDHIFTAVKVATFPPTSWP